jgi:hypothetical protein
MASRVGRVNAFYRACRHQRIRYSPNIVFIQREYDRQYRGRIISKESPGKRTDPTTAGIRVEQYIRTDGRKERKNKHDGDRARNLVKYIIVGVI